jgi:hypothetical protein
MREEGVDSSGRIQVTDTWNRRVKMHSMGRKKLRMN